MRNIFEGVKKQMKNGPWVCDLCGEDFGNRTDVVLFKDGTCVCTEDYIHERKALVRKHGQPLVPKEEAASERKDPAFLDLDNLPEDVEASVKFAQRVILQDTCKLNSVMWRQQLPGKPRSIAAEFQISTRSLTIGPEQLKHLLKGTDGFMIYGRTISIFMSLDD